MTTKFYINQKTKRMIKSPGKTFSKLKNKNVLKKDPCLYNITSAKKCFYKLLKFYPKVVYPSSNFVDIPKTYKMNTIKGLRAFIKQDNNIIAFINKHGFIYRLRSPININNIDNQSIPIVIDYNNTLPNFIKTLPTIDKNMQKKVDYQINTIKPNKNIHILFNHAQKDFIPINKKMDKKEHDQILRIFNDNLIKKTDYTTMKKSPKPSIITEPSKTILSTPEIYEIPDYPTMKKSPKPSIITEPSKMTSILPTPPPTPPPILTPPPTPPPPPYTRPSSTTQGTLPSSKGTTSSSVIPETSSTPLSTSFNLSFVGDKLMKTSEIPSSSVSSNIKIIQDESRNIIGFSEE
jgi:hypothetical protein